MTDAEGPRRNSHVGFALVAFTLVLLARLPVLIAHQDTWYAFEVHSGTIARAILDRVPLDWAHLPIVPHIRGGVLFGLLLVPFYALLPTSAFVMKLLPLLWNAASIAMLVLLFRRTVNRTAAIAATLLFVFAPPMLCKLSVVGLGSHLESMLFFVLALTIVARATRFGLSKSFGLGCVVGAAGFFHLQALLPALLVLALATPALLRSGPRAIGLCVLGIALCAAPSWIFAGGNRGLLFASLGSKHEAAPNSPDDEGYNPPPPRKLVDLVRHDYAYALEFGDVSSDHGVAIGFVFASIGFAFALAALLREGAAIRLFVFSLLRGEPHSPPLSLFFATHIVGIVLLYLVSHAHHQEEIAAGLTNRHLAPVFFSALALMGLGIGRIGMLEASPARGLLVALLLSTPSIAALPSIARFTPANSEPLRGECYEWFIGQIEPATRSRPESLLACLQACDRGDSTFAPLRFRIPFAPPADGNPNVAREAKDWTKVPTRVRPYAAVDSGRRLAGRVDQILDPKLRGTLDSMDPDLSAWFFRGVGLGIEPPRMVDPNASQENFHKRLLRILRAKDGAAATPILEGFGFQLGSVFEPYNANLREQWMELEFIPTEHRDALYRGLAWGTRQRYLTPPTTIPAGLAVLDLIPTANRAAFERAFTGLDRP